MQTREASMKKVENYIKANYEGRKVQLPYIEEDVFVQNVLLQFYELFFDKEELDCNTRYNRVKESPKDKFALKTSFYEVVLQSSATVQIQLELITGYISLSTNSNVKNDIETLHKIESELVICRGITQEDLDKKSMFFYHYQYAKKNME